MESSSATCTVKFTIKCPPPLYNNNFKERDGDICEPCPIGAVCSEDARYRPFAAPGYWRNAESGNGTEATQASFLPCSPPSACVSDQLSDGCAVGYTGVRCGTCSRNYYRLGSNCEKCPDNTWKNVLIFMACIVVGCIVLFALFNFVTRGPSLGFVSIVVGFLQTILILNDLKLKWSPSFQAAINNLSVFTLNIELTSPECMATEYEFDFAMKNRIALMVPLLFLLLLAFVPLFAWWRVRALGQFLNALIFGGSKVSIGELKQNQRRIWLLCLKVFNMFLNIIFVPAASQALELFDCSIESDGFYYLDAEPSSRCYTPKWAESLPISGMALIFYVVGIPTYFSFLYYSLYQTTRTSSFWMKRKQNAEAIVDKGSNHLKPESQHFVVVQIIQKLCFITVKLFFTKYIPLQAILINLILIGYLMFVVRHFPYRYTTLNNLELICTGASIFILNIGLLFYTQNFTTQGQIDALTGVALGSVFGSLILVGIAAIYEFKRSVQEWDLSRKNSVVQGSKRTSMLVA
ncbi:hypothetical protein BKA69DRAFT_1098922 [Paraphysoderma sedebokerense]|nr:hypothetical protein BKA69DRAFT_1098922 [Paraphysoderma sedebokerense]